MEPWVQPGPHLSRLGPSEQGIWGLGPQGAGVGALQEPESPLRPIETLESSEPLGNSGPQDF